jgi:hypothetical protein
MTLRATALSFAVCIAATQAAATPVATGTGAHGVLDGMVFVSTIDVRDYDTPFNDRMTFSNGTFFSEECQRRCNFGTAPYFTRLEGDSVAFVTDMVCPDAPQSVRWEGRITGDRIEGTAHWKVERFYWTVERHATFSGRLEPGADRQAAYQAE